MTKEEQFMSLRISAERTFTVMKELNYRDNSLNPDTARSSDGNYTRVAVLDPVMITFRKGLHEYTDKDLLNNFAGEPIESILEWPTVRAFIRRGIIIVATGILGADEEPVVKTKVKKPVKFQPAPEEKEA